MSETESRASARDLDGARVLVTGAGGFLGAPLCAGLLARGAEVHAVSRQTRSGTEARLRWWRSDVEDREVARDLVRSVAPDVVYHLGGLTHAAPDLDLLLPTFRSLLASTVHLIEAVAEAGRGRLLLVGSLEEPGSGGPEVSPSSPYAAAKWAACAYGRMAHELYGTSVVVLRTFMTYGPRQLERKIIPSTILSLLRRTPPRLSSGERRLDWIYVDDAVDAYLAAAIAPRIEGETLDVGSGTAVTIREIVERLVARVAPGVEPLFGAVPDRPVQETRVADVERTFSRMGWRPVTPLDAGLERTVAWYRLHSG